MKDIFVRCSKKIAVQVCTSNYCVLFLMSFRMFPWYACNPSLLGKLIHSIDWCLFFRRLKINHDPHELDLNLAPSRTISLTYFKTEKIGPSQKGHIPNFLTQTSLLENNLLQYTKSVVKIIFYIVSLSKTAWCFPIWWFVLGCCYWGLLIILAKLMTDMTGLVWNFVLSIFNSVKQPCTAYLKKVSYSEGIWIK
jgi:hypothetical protein